MYFSIFRSLPCLFNGLDKGAQYLFQNNLSVGCDMKFRNLAEIITAVKYHTQKQLNYQLIPLSLQQIIMCFLKSSNIRKKQASIQNRKIQSQQPDVHDFYIFDQSQGSEDILGSGASGTVFKAYHIQSEEIFAIKVTPKKLAAEIKNKFESQAYYLTLLDHPNIIKLIELYEDSERIYLVLQYCSGGELFDRIEKIEKFEESKARMIIKQLVDALIYLHDKQIVHRDLKLNNILFKSLDQNSDIKLIDFGFATKIEKGQKLRQSVGTSFYIAPQVLKGSYTEASDIWSLGIIFYILLFGYPPYVGETQQEILDIILDSNYSFEVDQQQSISQQAFDLLSQLLTSPKKRLKANEILQHDWMKGAKTLSNDKISDNSTSGGSDHNNDDF